MRPKNARKRGRTKMEVCVNVDNEVNSIGDSENKSIKSTPTARDRLESRSQSREQKNRINTKINSMKYLANAYDVQQMTSLGKKNMERSDKFRSVGPRGRFLIKKSETSNQQEDPQ